MNDKLYIIYEQDHWDGPLAGIGYYQGQLVYFDIDHCYYIDEHGQQISVDQVQRYVHLSSRLYDQLRRQGWPHQIDHNDSYIKWLEELTDQYDVFERAMYNIHKLSWFDKLRALASKKLFEVFVGYHWSYNRSGQRKNRFKMNRWFGLGRLLFKIYYYYLPKRKDEPFKDRPIITSVPQKRCIFGPPDK